MRAVCESKKFSCRQTDENGEIKMIWTIIGILVILWLIGLVANIGGGLVHLILVVAAIVLVYQLVTGRKVT